ncbi:MAG: hypothetical protein RIS29_275 [Bacteroidota bacterium]|jgi:DNA-binding response OmpR family regulator
MKTEKDKISLSEEEENLKSLLKVSSYRVGSFTVDVPTRMLIRNGIGQKLTTKESLLLILFAAHPNVFMDRKTALRMIWKDDNYYNSRSMDVYICKIRKLLSEDENVHIVNIHGKGYKLICPVG